MNLRLAALAGISVSFFAQVGFAAETTPSPSIVDLIPRGAKGVKMLSYTLEKDCVSTDMVRGMVLVHEGSSLKDIRAVYAKVNGKSFTKKKHRKVINPEDHTVFFAFVRTPDLRVCGGGTVDIYADFSRSATIGSTHRLYVEFGSDVMTEGDFVGVPTQGRWVEVTR